MNNPAASGGVSEDRSGMIMPPHLTLSRRGEGTVAPRSKLRGIIRIEKKDLDSIGTVFY